MKRVIPRAVRAGGRRRPDVLPADKEVIELFSSLMFWELYLFDHHEWLTHHKDPSGSLRRDIATAKQAQRRDWKLLIRYLSTQPLPEDVA
jgi:hypothetical protein